MASYLLNRWKKGRTLWSAAIPLALVLVCAGLALEPTRASLFLYVASVLCAGARVVRFVVVEVPPANMFRGRRLEPDEQPMVKTTRPIPIVITSVPRSRLETRTTS